MINKSPDPVDKHVGARVRTARLMRSMSQEVLGDRLGLTFQQVQKYEKGANRIGASRLQQISDILCQPISFFYQGAPSKNPNDKPADGEIDFVAKFGSTKEGVAIAKAFETLDDEPKLRASIVHLVEGIVESRK